MLFKLDGRKLFFGEKVRTLGKGANFFLFKKTGFSP